jgi:choline-sulfatase
MRGSGIGSDGYDHVVLVSLDTLRSDCIGATPWRLWQRKYPEITHRPPTQLLDQIVGQSAYFPNAITVTPYTAGAHAAAITGRWPLRNGVWEQFNRGLHGTSVFHRARRLGYRTLLKSDFSMMLGPSLGFTAAVDDYIEEDEDRFLDALAASSRSVSLVHFGSMHVPYGFLNLRTGGERYRQRVEELEEQYRPQVAMPVDRLAEGPLTEDDWNLLFRYKRIIQELMSTRRYAAVFELYLEGIGHFLKARFEPFWERLCAVLSGTRSLVVLFSDHGEEYDDVSYGHFNSIAEGVVRVPISFWGNDVRPGLHRGRVSCVDIVPTVLALLGDPDAGRLRLDGEPLTRSVLDGAAPATCDQYVQDYVSDTMAYIRFQERFFATGRKTGHLRHFLLKEAVYSGDVRLTRELFVRGPTGAFEPVEPRVRMERVSLDTEPVPVNDHAERPQLERQLDAYNALRPVGIDGAPRGRPTPDSRVDPG